MPKKRLPNTGSKTIQSFFIVIRTDAGDQSTNKLSPARGRIPAWRDYEKINLYRHLNLLNRMCHIPANR